MSARVITRLRPATRLPGSMVPTVLCLVRFLSRWRSSARRTIRHSAGPILRRRCLLRARRSRTLLPPTSMFWASSPRCTICRAIGVSIASSLRLMVPSCLVPGRSSSTAFPLARSMTTMHSSRVTRLSGLMLPVTPCPTPTRLSLTPALRARLTGRPIGTASPTQPSRMFLLPRVRWRAPGRSIGRHIQGRRIPMRASLSS